MLTRNRININEKLNLSAKITNANGAPSIDVVTNFAIKDSNIVAFTGASDQKTDNKGIATVEIQGKKTGETLVTAIATVEGDSRKR